MCLILQGKPFQAHGCFDIYMWIFSCINWYLNYLWAIYNEFSVNENVVTPKMCLFLVKPVVVG